jgi:hypothetical protein
MNGVRRARQAVTALHKDVLDAAIAQVTFWQTFAPSASRIQPPKADLRPSTSTPMASEATLMVTTRCP